VNDPAPEGKSAPQALSDSAGSGDPLGPSQSGSTSSGRTQTMSPTIGAPEQQTRT
jgi:hypothetical protein